MRRTVLASLLFAFALSSGCATSRVPLATTNQALQLDRVVLYRNGVGYFERRGEVDGDTLHIKVRKDQINDLLKSLTVVERTTGRAVSVSMPLDPASWASAALALLSPGSGNLADVLNALRGSEVVLETTEGQVRGRIVMVEPTMDEPDPQPLMRPRDFPPVPPQSRDHKITLLHRNEMRIVRLSQVRDIVLKDGDLALQLHRRLDASAGEGMFQQVDLAIRLVGTRRANVVVSYVVAAPMWKPTYRVVLAEDGKGKALLQGWAVVDNTSGEDWGDVAMSLTSGEPIAFQYDLHTPRDVPRADLTEAGISKQAVVAVGETSYDYAESAPEAPAQSEAYGGAGAAASKDDAAGDMDAEEREELSQESKKSESRRSKAAPAPMAPIGAPAPEPAVDFDSLRRSTLATARAKQVSGMTRFDLGTPVTIPNGTSTMVAIINEAVEAEQTFLYKPGGAGIGYEANPYRVVRFRNTTPFVLEPGPISIYSGGSFVGEGLSEAVGASTSATIPFAVEPSLMVSSIVEHTGDEMRLIRIVRGVLEVETFSRQTTTWTAKGRPQDDGFTVLVRHPKAGWNYQLQERPDGTEDLADAYLVPIKVEPKGNEGSVRVVEQTPSNTSISIWDGRAISLLEGLLASSNIGRDARSKLEPIVKLRQEIGRIDTEIDGLQRQQVELDRRAEETRRSLDAIKKDSAAGNLRAKLSSRLDEFVRDGDRLGRRVVELQSQRLDKKIQLEDLIQNLDLQAPAQAPKKGRPAATKASGKSKPAQDVPVESPAAEGPALGPEPPPASPPSR